MDNQCYVLTASPARSPEPTDSKYPHYAAWGHSTAVSPWGEVLATCEEDEAIVYVDVDLGRVKEVRDGIPTRSQRRLDLYNTVEGSN